MLGFSRAVPALLGPLSLLSSLGTILALIAVAAPARASEAKWEELSNEDGIVVWSREVPGTSLVEFRGRGLVKSPIKHLIAILRDQDRKTEWMANCVGNHAIEYLPGNKMVIYNRVGSPAPLVDDRDTVLQTEARFDVAARTVELSFQETKHPKMPAVEDVVRMPKTRGFWRLEYKDPNLTMVTYQVQADPGGSIPQWVVNWASKGLPRKTLEGLRVQATKGGYESQHAFLEAAFDWKGIEAEARAASTRTSTAVVTK